MATNVHKSTAFTHETAGRHSRRDVWRMFDRIAPRYDLLNRLLSGGRDVTWRKRLARYLPLGETLRVLDLATGTADVLLSLRTNSARVTGGVGMDMAGAMLRLGQDKILRRGDPSLRLARADAIHIPARDASFDVVTMAFGIRNVVDVSAALAEMRRVLKPGGRALILEFGLPANPLLRGLYLFYFRSVLPRLGALVSGDGHAYRYLNETVEAFACGDAFCEWMRAAGFRNVAAHPLTFGIAMIYQGDK